MSVLRTLKYNVEERHSLLSITLLIRYFYTNAYNFSSREVNKPRNILIAGLFNITKWKKITERSQCLADVKFPIISVEYLDKYPNKRARQFAASRRFEKPFTRFIAAMEIITRAVIVLN